MYARNIKLAKITFFDAPQKNKSGQTKPLHSPSKNFYLKCFIYYEFLCELNWIFFSDDGTKMDRVRGLHVVITYVNNNRKLNQNRSIIRYILICNKCMRFVHVRQLYLITFICPIHTYIYHYHIAIHLQGHSQLYCTCTPYSQHYALHIYFIGRK